MKLKILVAIGLLLSSPVYAQPLDLTVGIQNQTDNGLPLQEKIPTTTQNKVYEGNSGQKYKYDLSQPEDRLKYSVDPKAKLDDSINPNPKTEIDHSLNQYGGGALNDSNK